MKTILLFAFAACMQVKAEKAPEMVYVCPTPGATRYHLRRDCRGLSNCSKKVMKVTLADARKGGKTLCKWED